MIEKAVLSKSTFIRGWQCLKALYLYKNRYFLRDPLSPEQRIKFSRGHNVGDLARDLFPGGVNLAPGHPSQSGKAVEATARAIKDGIGVIYEAAFQAEQVVVFLDILVKVDGKWNAYEVKSSRKVSETYLMDSALQYHVITSSGLDIQDFFLVYMNEDYVLKDKLDIHNLFEFRNVSTEVRERNEEVRELLVEEKKVVKLPHSPSIDIGTWCNDPYPCDFRGHCWKNVPERSVFNIPSFDLDNQFKLYYDKKISPEELEKVPDLQPVQLEQVKSLLLNEVYLNKKSLQGFLPDLSLPVCLLHFSVFRPAVPQFEGNRPYHPLPFMFSIQYLNFIDTKDEYFLAESGQDPTKEFISSLNKSLENAQNILVYGRKDAFALLKEYHPEYAGIIEDLESRTIDLMEPFLQSMVFFPEMKGDYSIKSALTLFPEMEQHDFDKMNEVLAADLYSRLTDETDQSASLENEVRLKKYSSDNLRLIEKILDKINNLSG